MIRIKLMTIALFVCFFSCQLSNAQTLAPDGSYVGGSTSTLAPDGSYVGGTEAILAPDGTYVGNGR
jgi:hypothetical protein